MTANGMDPNRPSIDPLRERELPGADAMLARILAEPAARAGRPVQRWLLPVAAAAVAAGLAVGAAGFQVTHGNGSMLPAGTPTPPASVSPTPELPTPSPTSTPEPTA